MTHVPVEEAGSKKKLNDEADDKIYLSEKIDGSRLGQLSRWGLDFVVVMKLQERKEQSERAVWHGLCCVSLALRAFWHANNTRTCAAGHKPMGHGREWLASQ